MILFSKARGMRTGQCACGLLMLNQKMQSSLFLKLKEFGWQRPGLVIRFAILLPLLILSWLALVGEAPALADDFDFSAARKRMVEEQLNAPGRAIANPSVLKAMATVPRHEFVSGRLRNYAYADQPLPIGYDQTISQPYVVAFMTEKLAPKPTDRVLEIGTGSGYQAAVLSGLVAEVYSMEIVEALAQQADANLKRLGYHNVNVRFGDGNRGWPEAAPFDAIIVTCAPDDVPQALVDQLKDGGRLVIPVGEWSQQTLYLMNKRGGRLERQAVLPVRFVPMTGDSGNQKKQ